MKRNRLLLFWIGILGLPVLAAWAAPLRPLGPLEVTGTISEARWIPERLIKGLPGMSGSLGRDRVEAGHFLIKLIDYEGITPEAARTLTHYLEASALQNPQAKDRPSFVLLKIMSRNPDQLKPGLRIRVTGYIVTGDEGGTRTSCTEITILR